MAGVRQAGRPQKIQRGKEHCQEGYQGGKERMVPEEGRGDREGEIWRQEGMESYQRHVTGKERTTPFQIHSHS